MVRESAKSSKDLPLQSTGLDTAGDAALAAALAREEADRDLAIQLSGGKKPTDLNVSAASESTSTGGGGWMPILPDAAATTSSPDVEAVSPERQSDAQVPAGLSNPRERLALKVQIKTRAILLGSFAGILSGLCLMYFLGQVIFVYRDSEIPNYQEPIYYTVASGMLYVFLFGISILGSVAAWRQSLTLITAYLCGLMVATACKVIMSLALVVYVKLHLVDTLLFHGCGSPSEGQVILDPWTIEDCHSYRVEAITSAWVWVFPVLLCFAYILCAIWMRGPLAREAQMKRNWGGAEGALLRTASGDSLQDLTYQPLPAAHPGRPNPRRVSFNTAQNNLRIQHEFGMLDVPPPIDFKTHIVTPGDSKEPVKAQPMHEGIKPTSFSVEPPVSPLPKGKSVIRQTPPPSHTPEEISSPGMSGDALALDISDVVLSENAQELPANQLP